MDNKKICDMFNKFFKDKDNNKSEIEIKLNQCWSIGDVKELPTMFTKETSKKKVSYTCFEGGKIAVNINKLTA